MEKKGATKTKSQNSAQKFRTDPWLVLIEETDPSFLPLTPTI